jgi:hypothetical protein
VHLSGLVRIEEDKDGSVCNVYVKNRGSGFSGEALRNTRIQALVTASELTKVSRRDVYMLVTILHWQFKKRSEHHFTSLSGA